MICHGRVWLDPANTSLRNASLRSTSLRSTSLWMSLATPKAHRDAAQTGRGNGRLAGRDDGVQPKRTAA
jgi:hypothetical protein